MFARWPRPLTPRRRRALAREIEEELRAHLSMRAEDNRRDGMAPAEAEADARDRFGDVEHITAACLWAEQTHPVRDLQRIVVTGLLFAVAFGAFAVAFSLAWAVFVRPLRFDNADQIVRVGAGWENARVPFEVFQTWQAESASFTLLTSFDATTCELALPTRTERLRAMLVTEDYFNVFGVAPLIGVATLTEEPDVVAISEAFWERHFQRSRSALGATLVLNGHPHTVVAVMPKAAQLSHRVDLWHTLSVEPRRAEPIHYIIGRLRDGVTLGEARQEVARLSIGSGAVPRLYPLKRLYTDPIRRAVWNALGFSVLVLVLVGGAALRRALVRARHAALYGGGDEGPATQIGVALLAALAGLGIAHASRSLVYDTALGRWGPLFDRTLDAPVVLGVLGMALAVGVLTVLAAHWGRRTMADGWS